MKRCGETEKSGPDVREIPFKCRKTKFSEDSRSDNDSTEILRVRKTEYDENATQIRDLKRVESTKTRIQRRNKVDLQLNNEACFEIPSSKRSSIESSKNPSCPDLIVCHELSRSSDEDNGTSTPKRDDDSDEDSEEKSVRRRRRRRWCLYPQAGSNFSKIPTNLEIPDERINNVASVSSKTQKDTKPIKN